MAKTKTVTFKVKTSKDKESYKISAIERRFEILTLLANQERYTTKELADIYDVSIKTIQNDLYKHLVEHPIIKDDEGKLMFWEGYSLTKTMLDSDEMMILNMALSQFDDVADIDKIKNRIFQKLMNKRFTNPYYIKQDDIEDLEIDSPLIERLERLIKNQEIVKLELTHKFIEVELYKITNYDGFWYLFAKDLCDGKVKTIKLSKIKNVLPINRYHRVDHQTVESILTKTHSAFYDDGNSFEVLVKVYPEVAEYFKRKDFLESQKIKKENRDGSLEVLFEISHDEDLDNIVKAWLPHVEVLEPQRFKDRITDELKEYVSKLESASKELKR